MPNPWDLPETAVDRGPGTQGIAIALTGLVSAVAAAWAGRSGPAVAPGDTKAE